MVSHCKTLIIRVLIASPEHGNGRHVCFVISIRLKSVSKRSFSPTEICNHLNRMLNTKHSSALYIGMAKVVPIINVLGYDGQNSSFSSSPSSHSDSTPIIQKRSHIST